jgi:uncharacterized membrane protein
MTRFEKILLGGFFAWLFTGLAIMPLHIRVDEVLIWNYPAWLLTLITFCLRWGDFLFMVIAGANTYMMLVRQWSLSQARRWSLTCLMAGAAVETIGTLTSFPFGPYTYTENFGPRILGVLPLSIPLAWFVVVSNLLLAVRLLANSLSSWQEAAMVAAAATLFDWVMEPFAVQVKQYWLWLDETGQAQIEVPFQNYAAWWVVTFLLVKLFSPTCDLRFPDEKRPYFLLGGFLLLFAIGIGTA